MPIMIINNENELISLDPDDSMLYVPSPGDCFVCNNRQYRALGHVIDIDVDMLYIKCKELPVEA